MPHTTRLLTISFSSSRVIEVISPPRKTTTSEGVPAGSLKAAIWDPSRSTEVDSAAAVNIVNNKCYKFKHNG